MSPSRCGGNFYCPNRAVKNILDYKKKYRKTLLSLLIDLSRYLQSNGRKQNIFYTVTDILSDFNYK